MSLVANFDGIAVEYLLSETVNNYGRVKDSIEVYEKDRQSYNEQQLGSRDWDVTSVPDVWRYYPAGNRPTDFVSMTERFQHWIFQINVECMHGKRMSKSEYESFWQAELSKYKKNRESGSIYITWFNRLFFSGRAFTNKAGVDKFKNFIAQENLETDFPKFFNIVTGRFVGELTGATRKIAGISHSGLRCIHGGANYTDLHPFTHPHLFVRPTVTGRTLKYDKGGYTVTGYWWRVFDQFQRKCVVPFILPYDNEAFYPTANLVIPSDKLPGDM